MVPNWLHLLSIAVLAVGFACTLFIAFDEFRHPQRMWIMNIVWPVVALFGTVITLWSYFRYGRVATRENVLQAKRRGEDPPSRQQTPFPVMVGKGAAHCGSGCCLGDIAAEWLAFAAPGVAVALGWGSLFDEKMFAVWILDFIFAFALGIVFQYFTIKPMRGLSFGEGIVQAVKADTLSLSAWQVAACNVRGAVVEVTALSCGAYTPHIELLCYRGGPRGASAVSDRDAAATRLELEFEGQTEHQNGQVLDPDGHRLIVPICVFEGSCA